MTTDSLLPTVDEIKEILSLTSIHCTAKGEDYDVAISMQIAMKIRDKILERRLDRPKLREEIAEATYHFVHRGKTHMDWSELPYKWGKKAYYEFADQLLALKPTEEEIRKQQQVEDTAYYAEMMKVATDRVGKEAKRAERERMLAIVKKYGLDTVSARDDALERQAKGWQVLKEEE